MKMKLAISNKNQRDINSILSISTSSRKHIFQVLTSMDAKQLDLRLPTRFIVDIIEKTAGYSVFSIISTNNISVNYTVTISTTKGIFKIIDSNTGEDLVGLINSTSSSTNLHKLEREIGKVVEASGLFGWMARRRRTLEKLRLDKRYRETRQKLLPNMTRYATIVSFLMVMQDTDLLMNVFDTQDMDVIMKLTAISTPDTISIQSRIDIDDFNDHLEKFLENGHNLHNTSNSTYSESTVYSQIYVNVSSVNLLSFRNTKFDKGETVVSLFIFITYHLKRLSLEDIDSDLSIENRLIYQKWFTIMRYLIQNVKPSILPITGFGTHLNTASREILTICEHPEKDNFHKKQEYNIIWEDILNIRKVINEPMNSIVEELNLIKKEALKHMYIKGDRGNTKKYVSSYDYSTRKKIFSQDGEVKKDALSTDLFDSLVDSLETLSFDTGYYTLNTNEFIGDLPLKEAIDKTIEFLSGKSEREKAIYSHSLSKVITDELPIDMYAEIIVKYARNLSIADSMRKNLDLLKIILDSGMVLTPEALMNFNRRKNLYSNLLSNNIILKNIIDPIDSQIDGEYTILHPLRDSMILVSKIAYFKEILENMHLPNHVTQFNNDLLSNGYLLKIKSDMTNTYLRETTNRAMLREVFPHVRLVRNIKGDEFTWKD